MAKLFGTTGIRGMANILLTPEFCSKIASAFGNYVGKNKKVLIGMDPRTSSVMIKNAVASGLLSAGCEVYDAGISPTPAIQYCTKKFDFDAGIMITGSHIPPERNGMKFFLANGTEVYGRIEENIERIYFSNGIKRVGWDGILPVHAFDANSEYKEMLLANGVSDNLKIVVDPGHGTQSNIVPQVLRELGHKVITLNAQMDGFFPGRYSEPDEKNLSNLIGIVKNIGADLGIGIDGDGDRAIFVDDAGRFIMGDVTGSIIADHLMKTGDKVVTPVSTSSVIDFVAKKHKGAVIRTKVGAADVVAETIKQKAAFSFEENGGCIFPGINPARDGGLTTVFLLRIIKEKKQKFSGIVDSCPKFYQLKKKIECEDGIKLEVVKKIKLKFAGNKIDSTDGVKIFSDEGWILMRPSWTEPIFRIFTEAQTPANAKKLMETGEDAAREAVSECKKG